MLSLLWVGIYVLFEAEAVGNAHASLRAAAIIGWRQQTIDVSSQVSVARYSVVDATGKTTTYLDFD